MLPSGSDIDSPSLAEVSFMGLPLFSLTVVLQPFSDLVSEKKERENESRKHEKGIRRKRTVALHRILVISGRL